eukprot:gene9823-2145_t
MFGGRASTVIENKQKDNQTVTEGKMSQCFIFTSCEDSTYKINPKKISKIVIEKCKNTQFTIDTILITSTIEFIGCSNIDVDYTHQKDSPDLTIQMDKSSDVKIKISGEEMSNVTMISTFDSKNISFVCPEMIQKDEISYKSFDIKFDEKVDCFQFKTIYSKKEKCFKTEPIVRQENQGYIK